MGYKEVLKLIGWPERVLIIDFETYFDQDYSITKMSTIEYIMDPRFELLGCGIGDMHSVDFITKPELSERMASVKADTRFENVTVIAKNCKFDITILAVKFGIIPPFIIDIDDLLRSYDARMSHKMKDVTKMFGLRSKGDTNQFKGLHYEDMDDSTKSNLAKYCNGDIKIETKLFQILLPQISAPEIEIPVARHTLDLYLKPKIKFDFRKASDLKIEMLIESKQTTNATEYKNKDLSGNLSFVKLLIGALPEGEKIPTKAGKPGKNMVKLLGKPGVIPAFAKDDLGFQELLVHSDPIVRDLCLARQAIRSWPLHIRRISNLVNQATASGGLLRVPLHYFGAHTGRWSGGEKINLQNLGGRGRGGQGTHPLIAGMRGLLGTPDGYILGIVDSAQVEARILAWFADQEDLLRGFVNGEDIYSVFATELFNSAVYKPKEDEFAPVKKLLKIRRGFGKDAILGCGYGMGTNRFYDNCISNCDLRPLFDSGDYNRNFIDNLIRTYRSTYSCIPKFWKDVEKAFKWVIKYPHEQTQVSRKYDEQGNADGFRLEFFNRKGTVHLKLPSGRELTYRHCALKQTTKGQEIRWHYGHLWGGSITENIVQATARDLLVYWILEMENRGENTDSLPVVFHNHDEIICMLYEDEAESGLQSMLQIMKRSPEWANGLPLDAEGELSRVYKT